jgi:hypothetical protein
MSKIAKMLAIALVVAAIAVMLVAGTALAATGNGHGSSSEGEQPGSLNWGWEDSHQGPGVPSDVEGPLFHEAMNRYGMS